MPYRLQIMVEKARRIPFIDAMIRSRYEREFSQARNANLFRGVFESVSEAKASVPEQGLVGYDHAEPAAMYRERLERIYPADYPVLFWLKDLLMPSQSVFDLGGHVGVAYYSYSQFLDYPEDLRWTVCDVPAVVESGRSLAQELGKNQLAFTADRTLASGADVFHAAGVLQYLADPLPDILGALDAKPKHVIINLCAFTEGKPFVTLQNIGTTFCPYVIHRRADIFEGLQALGYQLVDDWENPEKSCHLPMDPSFSIPRYVGAYFSLNG